MKRLRIGLGLLGAVGTAFAVAACQAPTTTTPAATTPAATTPAAAATTAPAATTPAAATPVAQAKPSGVLRAGTTNLTRTLDALETVGQPSGAETGWAVAESLVIVDGNTGEVVPWLAESWVAPTDGVTWTFRMRPNARFSDGSPVTAQDVKATFDNFLDTENRYTQAARIVSFFDSTTAVDANTFQIKTRQPDAILPRRIAAIVVIKADSWVNPGKAGMAERAPITTGPYVVKDFVPSVSMTLEPNPHAWRVPGVQTVELRNLAEEAIRVGALRTGELDVAAVIPESAVALDRDGKTIHRLNNASNTSIIVDSASPDAVPATRDRRVREALAISLDRESLVRNLTEGFGRTGNQAVAQEAFGFNTSLPQIPYNPARARQLVQEAGFTGTTLQMSGVFGSGSGLATLTGVQAMIAQMSQSGINVELSPLEVAVFLQRYNAGGLPPLMIFPLGAAGNDADGAILNFRTETNPVPATIRYTNPEFDRAYLASRVEFDVERRRALLGQALKILADDWAVIPVGNQPSIWALQPKVQGFKPYSNSAYNWTDIRVQ